MRYIQSEGMHIYLCRNHTFMYQKILKSYFDFKQVKYILHSERNNIHILITSTQKKATWVKPYMGNTLMSLAS